MLSRLKSSSNILKEAGIVQKIHCVLLMRFQHLFRILEFDCIRCNISIFETRQILMKCVNAGHHKKEHFFFLKKNVSDNNAI